MGEITRLFVDSVTTRKSHRHWVVESNPRQVNIWVDRPNLVQAVVKPVAVVDSVQVNKGLGSPELRYGIGLGILRLLMEARQFRLQACLGLLRLLSETVFLLQLLSNSC